MKNAIWFFCFTCIIACRLDTELILDHDNPPDNIAAISLQGKELLAPPPSQKLLDQYEDHKAIFLTLEV